MSTCAELTSASVLVTLDTTPPVLTVVAGPSVSPPDSLAVTITSSEVIGSSTYAFLDSSGTSYPLGALRLDSQTDYVLIPSQGLSAGAGTLLVTVTDEVCNPATLVVPVYVSRPIPYDLTLGTTGIFALTEEVERVYELTLDSVVPFGLELIPDRVLELDITEASLYDLEVGTYDGS